MFVNVRPINVQPVCCFRLVIDTESIPRVSSAHRASHASLNEVVPRTEQERIRDLVLQAYAEHEASATVTQ